ncbi:autotransporter domain-containing protein [Bradyrhizobium japonicum]|uniref:autotransporter outer membrane beta-barrel domain-containing protein n=1 Tax=Bradyrhizobium japonicum TaxID=375 RepID=UPI001BAAC20E|nr:autotransporter domain-containing protein [Bradyrhizobium japonicum]MBR0746541.1 autotransporter domain-containing protein [Bradyrhizobium japonicum]
MRQLFSVVPAVASALCVQIASAGATEIWQFDFTDGSSTSGQFKVNPANFQIPVSAAQPTPFDVFGVSINTDAGGLFGTVHFDSSNTPSTHCAPAECDVIFSSSSIFVPNFGTYIISVKLNFDRIWVPWTLGQDTVQIFRSANPLAFSANSTGTITRTVLDVVQGWAGSPVSSDWNTAANWTTGSVPTSNEVPVFGPSTITAIDIKQPTQVGGLSFASGAPAYTFNVTGSPGGAASLVIGGTGIDNASGNNPNFVVSGVSGNPGTLQFANSATAGDAIITTNAFGKTLFTGSSSGGTATLITNSGGVVDISGLTSGGIGVGAISGSGQYVLGAKNLSAGSLGTDTEVSGVISGTVGSLTKVGTGTLTLSGANTYSGGTTVSGGTLALSGAGTLGAASGSTTVVGAVLDLGGTSQTQNGGVTLQAGGTIKNGTLSSSATFTLESGMVQADLAGSGGLNKTTSGTVTLFGAKTYTGNTTVSGGTLKAGSDNAFSVSSTTGVGGATLDLGGFSHTINFVILGGNAKLKSGLLAGFVLATGPSNSIQDLGGTASIADQGLLTFSGHSTYSGVTTVDYGAAALNSQALSANSAFIVNSGATLDLGGFSQTIGSLHGAGDVTMSGDLKVGGDNWSTNFSGRLIGAGGFTKEGSGRMVLSGDNSAYHGEVTVNGGTLDVQSFLAFSPATVNASAALAGIGSVGATLINSGGILAPGDGTPGTSMTLMSLDMQSGAQYFVQLNPTTSSYASVTGTASLGGATVNAFFAGGSYVEKRYTILVADNVTGTFDPATVNTNLPSGFKTSLNYDPTHAYLDLSLAFVPPPGGGLSGNQASVGNAIINFFDRTGSIPLVFGALTPAALTQLSGENVTAPQQTTFTAMNQFTGLMTDPFLAGRGGPAGVSASSSYSGDDQAYAARARGRSRSERDAYAAIAPPVPSPSFEQRWSVWAAGFGGSQRTEGSTVLGSNETRSSLYGTVVGADYRLSPNTLTGFALAGGGTSFGVGNLGSGRSDLFQAGGFVRHDAGAAYITAALAYGWQNINTDRIVAVAGIDRLHAEFKARAWSGRLEGGYRFVAGGFGLTPYTAGQFTSFELPAYVEQAISGAKTLALAYGAQRVANTRSELGLRGDKSFAMERAVLIFRGRAAWAHDFDNNRAATATFQTLPGASFVVNGAAMAPDSALVTATAEMNWLNGWSTATTFEGEFSRVTESYAGRATVRYAWP